MKYIIRFFFIACITLLFSANIFAQKFEGTMTTLMTSSKLDQPMTMITSVKGDKSVMEMQTPQGNIKMYMDQSSKKKTTVMESMKMGMESDMKKTEPASTSSNSKPPVIKNTGEKKAISGHNCECYHVITQNGDESNWWMTDDAPKPLLAALRDIYDRSNSGMRKEKIGPSAEAIEVMFKKGLMPIVVESLNKDVKPETTMTFVSFEQKKT
jgi:hypothetical protein